MHREQVVVDNERTLVKRNLERHKIDVIRGEAYLKDAHTIGVRQNDGTELELTTEIILIATGSSPFHPENVPFDELNVFDSDSILRMDHIPHSMAVIGGGVIGSEYASIFTALSVQVTLVESKDRILSFVDKEICDRLCQKLENLGLRFIFNERIQSTEIIDNCVYIKLDGGETLEIDTALFTSGRQGNTKGLGLEALGIQPGKRGLILVNEYYQTTIPNIYAAGDVIGFPALASTSMEQARTAMAHAFGLRYQDRRAAALPLAVYTVPEIATVGLNEEDCQQKGIPYLVGRAYYEKSSRGQIIGDMTGMLKLIFSPEDKQLLGVHQIGELASELVHIGAQVLSRGDTIDEFIHAVYNYPTLADSYKYAAYDGLIQHDKWLLDNGETVYSD